MMCLFNRCWISSGADHRQAVEGTGLRLSVKSGCGATTFFIFLAAAAGAGIIASDFW